MNVIAPTFRDSDQFLRWNLGREGKRELVHGRVAEMMVGATRMHARRVRRLARALEDCLDPGLFEVATSDLGVKTAVGVRYPDLVVDRAGSDGSDLAAAAPVLIAEVLSPSSLAIDLVDKVREYRDIASVAAYLVLAPDEARLWLWSRGTAEWSGPVMIEGAEGVVQLAQLGLSLRLADVYSDLRA